MKILKLFNQKYWLPRLNYFIKGVGVLIIILFFGGCTQKSKNNHVNKKTYSSEETSQTSKYLVRSTFPFEMLSAEAIIGNAVEANGNVLLSYELNLANGYHSSIIISKIEVFDYDKKRVLSTFDSTYLLLHLLRPGVKSFDEVLEIKTSGFGVANLWLELDKEEIPENFFHRVTFKIKDKQGQFQEVSIDLALEKFPEQINLKIGLPFHKGKWFYVANAHRDARVITEGKPAFPQRYAIDWAALTDDNKIQIDSSSTISNYKAYNEDLIAVSDAKVIFTKDSIPDNDPFGNKLAIEITRETVGGNYVVLDIGNGIYAFYGHLIPGSLTVAVGDKVQKGEVIGKLGNSGRSFAPHLHFHLEAKSKYPLGGEGIPYIFESFNQLASFKDEENYSILSSRSTPVKLNINPMHKTNLLPIGNGVVEF